MSIPRTPGWLLVVRYLFRSGQEEEGELDFYLGFVVVPLDVRRAKSDQGSLFVLPPFRPHLGRFLFPRSLLTRLLLARPAELRLGVPHGSVDSTTLGDDIY